MKTLGEIIDQCKAGGVPSDDEMRYAICAMDALMTFDGMALSKLVEQKQKEKPQRLVWCPVWQYEERFGRLRRALGKSPKDYLGPNFDPDSEAVQQRRKASMAMMRRALDAAEEGSHVTSD